MSNVRAQDDLFEYVNGEYLATAVIPDDRPMTGGFADLLDGVEKTMMADFAAFAKGEKTSDILGMKDAITLYKKVLDTEKRNKDGITPALPLLNKIVSIKSLEQFNSQLADLVYDGVEMPISFGVEADMKNATTHSFIMSGPSTILPDTTYYSQPIGQQLIEVYKNSAAKALALTDLSEQDQKQYLEDTITYDALIAKKVKSMLEWADYVKNYNPMPLEEVCSYVAPMDLKGLLSELFDGKLPETIVVYDPRAIKEMNGYFSEENFQLYLHWTYVKTLMKNAAYLSEELAAISTEFRRTLTGVAADPVIEKQAYQVASSVYSEAVGVYYGREYFGEEAKKDITDLVKRIIETWKLRVSRNTFLEQPTKDKAILKLSTITIKMGYPDDVLPIYGQMKLDEQESYYSAVQKISKIKMKDSLNDLYEPVNPNKWLMPGHMVNACYDPSRNDITFPAAILQKPFYSIHQTISENLGGIGAVISHEISHAFDNNGSHFDENGNLFNWWTENDEASFKELTKQMIQQWDGIEFGGGKVNGELVVSENIADNGGIAVTLEIMHQIEDADFVQYFTNWARIWCQKAKPEYVQLLLNNDVHSPNKLRANIQIRNFKEWYEAFGVTENDQMYIPEDKRIIIW